MNSLLFQHNYNNLPNPAEAFIKWMVCAKSDGNTPEICSLLAGDLFPLSVWRNVTADAARAAFGTVFFVVELTKGYDILDAGSDNSDFWRALKERHPFALTFARGPRTRNPALTESEAANESKVGISRQTALPFKLRFSFLRRPRTQNSNQTETEITPEPQLQLPELSFRRNDIRVHQHHNSFPRSYQKRRSSTSSPRVYLHTPQRELEKLESRPPPSRRSYMRRFSLPTNPQPAANSAPHMPVSVESFSPPSTRASLRSIATESLALGNVLEKAHAR